MLAGDVRLRKPMYVRFFLLAGRMLAVGNHTRPPTRKEVEGEWERDTSARPGTDEVGAGWRSPLLPVYLPLLPIPLLPMPVQRALRVPVPLLHHYHHCASSSHLFGS